MYAQTSVADTAPQDVSALTAAARNDLYGDTVNEELLMKPGRALTATLTKLDDHGIDGAVEAVGAAVGATSGRLRALQTGYARTYALSMLAGAALLIAVILAVQLW
jgi:NADH-quinone oxidoreductase subunit L